MCWRALRLLLKREGYKIEAAESLRQALQAIENRDFDAGDYRSELQPARHTTSGQEVWNLLAAIQRADSTLPVVVMTAWSSIDLAVEQCGAGARDFVPGSPWGEMSAFQLLSERSSKTEPGSSGMV